MNRSRRCVRLLYGAIAWITIVFAWAMPVSSQPVQDVREAVHTYLHELDRVERAATRVSLQHLFTLARGLQDPLVRDGNYLETLSDEDMEKLQADLRGMDIGAGDYVWAEPLPTFYRDGSGILVSQFAKWRQFIARHRPEYATYAQAELEDVKEELTESDCACGDSLSVLSEYRLFLRRLPGDPVAPVVRKRIGQITRGESGITFNCPPPHYR